MRVLVTGSTGYIGQYLIRELLLRGHDVTAVARDEEKARQCEWYGCVTFISVDIYQKIDNPFTFFGSPDVLVHLAWNGLPNYGELFHFETNANENYQFLKGLIQGGLSQLLVAGTCLEYGMQNGCLSEEAPSQPVNAYALAKDTLRKSLELLIQGTGVRLQWARLFYMYGPGQKSSSLLAQLDRALDNRDSYFNMSCGDQLRDYLPVNEVASKIVRLTENMGLSGIYNICSGNPISVRRLVENRISERNQNIRLNLGYHPISEYEPLAFWGDPRKFLSNIEGAL